MCPECMQTHELLTPERKQFHDLPKDQQLGAAPSTQNVTTLGLSASEPPHTSLYPGIH
ncbi:hypothetical protein PC129_g10138 [Phytophthora cactorum]|uniref:Uncharacterized protein n=1 Tax=Phytophthora cactorum TaxID=29920 RepID=A0A8T1KJR8_9STRA|nr:hypothetical protein Pcac1_g236 [Phytophthora cactorum]KAG2855718.1 hypothetical protein PC113_g12206 [Phytophthora cactorum]KAG2902067.1 hypothetical protein PC114_g12889 [Phytophthora cactorum]KAG2906040.1 hypothetical protein PC115_g14421 [Phytophthora cactorum]KAG2935120.1 hypothetical protein PC117_g12465 [Phytophthora cactorum]